MSRGQVVYGDAIVTRTGRLNTSVPLLQRLDFSHGALDLAFSLDRGLVLERWARPSTSAWIEPSSPLCTVAAGGRRFDGRSPDSDVRDVRLERSTEDVTHAVIVIGRADVGLQIDLHIVVYPGTALLEQWVVVRNTGIQPVRIDRLDSFALHLPRGKYELLSFSSGWGAEFEGVRRPLIEPVVLESRSLRGAELKRSIRPRNLDPSALYRLEMVDDGSERWRPGSDLMREGIYLDWLNEDDSAIVIVSEEHSGT
jgi:Glycosyl hydrolase family 36 N-terminal domain